MLPSEISYQAMVDAVFVPDPRFPATLMTGGAIGKVYRIETEPPFVVKVNPWFDEDQYRFQAELSEAIVTPEPTTPRIVHWEAREIEGKACGVQVYPYLAGKPLQHVLTPEQARIIGQTVHELHQRLCAATPRFMQMVPSLQALLQSHLDRLEACPVRDRGYWLLENAKFRGLMGREDQYLVAFDPNPGNLLFDDTSGELRVRIVDLAVVAGPAVLQPACLFAACFMVLHGEHLDLKGMLEYWPEALDLEEVLLMMQPWFLIVGAEKEHLLTNHGSSEPERLRSWIDTLVRYTDAVTTVKT